ncbi:MAG: insulinase family protein [Gemmatimonadaceae bacterium]|nr:insulinase family protein [Gemmatimonadaceae bacterium]
MSIGAWVRSATAHETAREMGISHLLEHMVFKGTARRDARSLALALEARGGSLDAFTSREHTAFEARILPADLPLACDVIGDLVFDPLLVAADLALEQKVILEEIATAEETPEDIVFELHAQALWGEHPYGFPILGTAETVPAIDVAMLRARHAGTFVPNDIVVAAAGDVTHDALVAALCAEGWDQRVPGAVVRATVAPPAPVVPAAHFVERDLSQVHVVLGAPALPHGDPLRYALALASNTLGGGMSSRLFQRVREELGLAYAVYTFSSAYRHGGMHGMYVASADESARDAVVVIQEELERIARDGLSREEVAEGREQLKGQVVLALEGSGAHMARAAAPDVHDEPYRSLDDVLAEIDAVTMEQVAQVCATVLHPAQQTVLSLGPRAAA